MILWNLLPKRLQWQKFSDCYCFTLPTSRTPWNKTPCKGHKGSTSLPLPFSLFCSFSPCERFTRWLHEMNPLGLGNVPFHAPIRLCYVWAVRSFTLSPSISSLAPVALTGCAAELVSFTTLTIYGALQWIEERKKKFQVTTDKVQSCDILRRFFGGKLWTLIHNGLNSSAALHHQLSGAISCFSLKSNRSQLRGFRDPLLVPVWPSSLLSLRESNSIVSIPFVKLLTVLDWKAHGGKYIYIYINPDLNHTSITNPRLQSTNRMHIYFLFYFSSFLPSLSHHTLSAGFPLNIPLIPKWSW